MLTKKSFFLLNIFFIYLFSASVSLADLQKNLINKLTAIKTLSFDFKQKISDKEEIGNCFIKYPLLMKCNYQNLKQKTIISNGKTVAVIKKKYKKIYYYPIKLTPLFFILKKEKIINLIRKNQPTEINAGLIEFQFVDQKANNVKILFDKNSLEFKGWKTKDVYSNNVSFTINNLKINNQIIDDFFKIPKEEDL
ncbi:MAG TPA: outer membrane lipoprotein carrier protein LolA [Pelagibacteraceae bacterium]|nr:outer membrane lipoprotein carrier protein LolA [Pelagibacteraceae bacterium]